MHCAPVELHNNRSDVLPGRPRASHRRCLRLALSWRRSCCAALTTSARRIAGRTSDSYRSSLRSRRAARHGTESPALFRRVRAFGDCFRPECLRLRCRRTQANRPASCYPRGSKPPTCPSCPPHRGGFRGRLGRADHHRYALGALLCWLSK